LKPGSPADGATTKIGSMSVTKELPGSEECDRDISLIEPSSVYIFARWHSGRADLCRIADVATDAAIPVLNSGKLLSRRPEFDEKSLANKDACTLLDASTLAGVGVDGGTPHQEFGSWDCRWGSTSARSATVRFDQGPPLTPTDDGQPIKLGRWNAFVKPDGDDDGNNCVVSIEYRDFAGNGRDEAETVRVVLVGPQPPVPAKSLCSPANRLAAVVASNL
jgi:hypothetical protein